MLNVKFEAMNLREKIEKLLAEDYGCFDDKTVDKLLNLHSVSKRYHFEWEDDNNETKHFYISVTKEEDAFNEFYSHFPNAKYVMVSKS